jgi:tetratricopeptide (TPR) repeat protein
MFCRSCWANIPDGSPACPKCQADLTAGPGAPAPGGAAPTPDRAPPAPPSSGPAPPTPPASALATPGPPAPRPAPPPASRPAPAARGGDWQNRLIALVALLLLTIVAGPTVVGWVVQRRDDRAVTPEGGGSVRRPSLEAVGAEPEPTDGGGGGSGADAAQAQEAFTLFQQGRVAEACERYRDLARRVDQEAIRRNLGACLARLGRQAYQADLPDEAVRYYEQAIEAHPGTSGVWQALALALAKARNLGRAQSVLEQAAQRFPDDPEILYLLAEMLERQGRTREAADALRRLLERHPSHARGRTLLAAIEKEQKVEGDYWTQESRHFVVRFEGARALDTGRSVVDSLEEAYDSIGRDLGHFPADRMQVGIYSTEVLGQVIGIPAHFIRGAFDGRKIRLNLAESVAYSNDFSRLVRHEYTHAVIHEVARGRAPIWVHEGLAQVMEGRSAPRALEWSVPRQYLTLNGVEQLARTMEPMAFTTGYQLTHVAVEHLVDRGGIGRVREFLVRLGRGESVEQALQGAFGFGVEEVESRLLRVAGLS